MKESTSPMARKIARDYPEYMTQAQLAAKLKRSKSTIEDWRRRGWLEPTISPSYGKLKVHLYDADSLKRGKEVIKRLKPGRKSPEQLGVLARFLEPKKEKRK